MRIVFAGTPKYAVPSLLALIEAGHSVAGVLTREDAPVGRKRTLTPSPVALAAAELGLVIKKSNRFGADETEWVREMRAELGVIVAYGGLVREPALSLPAHGWVNLHFSDLPRWRGAAPVQRALQSGELTLGVTVFRLVEELDAGDILTRDSREFAEGVTAGEVLTHLSDVGTGTLLRAIRLLETHPDAGEPQVGVHSYARKLSREDGRLDLSMSSSAVLAHWAGMTPEPGAFVLHEGQPLKLLQVTRAASATPSLPSGRTLMVNGKSTLSLNGGALELVLVQPAGKAAMSGADWLRGRGGEAELS